MSCHLPASVWRLHCTKLYYEAHAASCQQGCRRAAVPRESTRKNASRLTCQGCWHAGRYDGSEVAVKVMQLLEHQAHAPLSEINPLSLSHPGVVRRPALSPLHGPSECGGLGR